MREQLQSSRSDQKRLRDKLDKISDNDIYIYYIIIYICIWEKEVKEGKHFRDFKTCTITCIPRMN